MRVSFSKASVYLLLVLPAAAQQVSTDFFETKIRPVLASRCYSCHSASATAVQGGLRLDTVEAIRRGGNSGSAIQPGDADRSLLLRALQYKDKTLKMPPGKPLPEEVVSNFAIWIQAGAAMPVERTKAETPSESTLWSLKKPRLAPNPVVKQRVWIRNEIDGFILSRLEDKALAPSAEADKRTLIRRVSFDLTGLPPSAKDVEEFVQDNSAGAYERLLDRLLASPQYGERWARHWLDVARYADSVNDSVNAGQRFPWSYTYRDWVITALNEDMPYNRFVQFQLAADRMPGSDPRNLAALGFLSLGREFPKSYPETVDDRVDAVTRGFLGFTVACARCHDHKYDPIPTKDYYSLYSVFSNIREPKKLPQIDRVSELSPKQKLYSERLSKIEQDDNSYRVKRHAEMIAFFKTQTAEYLLAAKDAEHLTNSEIEELVRDRQLNSHVLGRWRNYLKQSTNAKEPVINLWLKAAATPEKEFPQAWPQLRDFAKSFSVFGDELDALQPAKLQDVAGLVARTLAQYDREEPFSDAAKETVRSGIRSAEFPVNVPLNEFELIYTEGDSNNTRSIRVRYNTMLAQSAYDGAPKRAMAVEDLDNPVPGHVFIRGNAANPGALTPPRFLTSLGGSDEKPFKNGSGRLELAQAITDPENPMTSRAIVNRVWMHHFGFGLVRTPSDLGFRGDRPTHPELLDYLAIKFVEGGWSLKKLHRLIMTSATYRQASADNPEARNIDPENQLLWRMNRRRLEIESLRDSMLVAAGRLDLKVGGLPFALTAEPAVPRRSVYGFIERGRVPALLSAFDFASPDQHAPLRHITTVPQQALFLLNSSFVAEQASYIASRPDVIGSADVSEKIQQIYAAMFGRRAEQWELDAGIGFVSQKTELTKNGQPAPVWLYGTGKADPEAEKVTGFVPFSTFVPDRWQGGAALPAAISGKASLTPTGGEAGDAPEQAVVRRWVSPVKGNANIEGVLRHGQPAVPFGDGVRGQVLSSRHGALASWNVNGSTAETKLNGIAVEPGDTLDFVVDSRKDPENDNFGWSPTIKVGVQTWSAKDDFAGPLPRPLSVWARYAQVLLETNEFAFVD